MEARRWLALSPVAVAVVATSLAGMPPLRDATAATGWDVLPCAEPGPPSTAITWFRLDPVLDRSGTLSTRRLTTGVEGGVTRVRDLAPESFASGPVGGRVLTGEDDGRESRLRLLDPARGCATDAGVEAGVIRSAVLASDGASIIEHRVDRATRADLGVFRRPLDGRPPRRLLDGLAADPALGPTWSTDLALAADGTLTVSSCAPLGCRVRVVDPDTGDSTLVRDAGPAVGAVGDVLLVREACEGWPCPIESVDLTTGDRRHLVDDAYAAAVSPDGTELVVETAGGTVTTVRLATGDTSRQRADGAPVPRGSTGSAGVEDPAGRMVLAVEGRPRAGAIRIHDADHPSFRRNGETDR